MLDLLNGSGRLQCEYGILPGWDKLLLRTTVIWAKRIQHEGTQGQDRLIPGKTSIQVV